jgi:hypothetical protein
VWDNSITEKNVFLAFIKCGIWPIKPDIILDVIIPPNSDTSLNKSLHEIATPYIVKRIRQFLKLYTRAPLKLAFRKLTKANETNAARALIAEHRAKGLREAL